MDVHSDAQHTLGVAEAAVLLPVPDLARVSDAQYRGAACVWCGVILSPATAVGLGKRPVRRLDRHTTASPRGCRTCTAARVPAVRQGHADVCEQCVDSPAVCGTARALRHLEMAVSR